MTIKVRFYAVLKDYFADDVLLDIKEGYTVMDLINSLTRDNPSAEAILGKSRVATDAEILSDYSNISTYKELSVFPPSSGG